ncbi:hypothetical protein D3C71_1254730 [compost metagenome]
MFGAARIQVLHSAVLDHGAADCFAGAECAFNGVAVAQVLELGADERRAFTRFNVLEVQHGEDIAVYLDGQACLKIVNGNHELTPPEFTCIACSYENIKPFLPLLKQESVRKITER